MKSLFILSVLSLFSLVSSSCLVASVAAVPFKVAGDVVEGTYNVGKAIVTSGNDEDEVE